MLNDTVPEPPSAAALPPPHNRNIIKMNLASLTLKNYNFSYERLITRKTSVIASFRTMPQTNLGSLKLAAKLAAKADVEEELNLISASNNTLTAEIRFYGGRKPGAKGFYFGLYGRTGNFKGDYQYSFAGQSKDYLIPLQGSARGIGGGFVTGAQFAIAKRMVVDLYLLGMHYGTLKGDLHAAIDLSGMDASEQSELAAELNDLLVVNNTSFVAATVNDNGIKGTLKGPFAGLRGLGLTIGIGF